MKEKTIVVSRKELPVRESLKIVKRRLCGGVNRRRISIVTGTHGDELEGQFVCYELIRRIKAEPEKLLGTVDVYPALNPMGVDTITRGIPGFDLDMNRTFPGNKDGAETEQTAADVVNDLTGSDLVVDIHASNIFLTEMPQVRISEETAEALVPYAKDLNVDLVWIHAAATVLHSTLAHSLNERKTRTLVVETGVGMRVTEAYGRQLADGIFNVMKRLGIWKGEPERLREPICFREEVEFINAPVSGLFLPAVSHTARVRKGDVIGHILEPLRGVTLAELKAGHDGLVFTIREYPVVDEGSLIARILIGGGDGR